MFALKQVHQYKKFTQLLPKRPKSETHHRNVVNNDHLNIEIGGEQLQYPKVWLRDNCQCKLCFHPSAKSRIIDWSKFDINIGCKHIVTQDNSLKITWDDGHISEYPFNWLKLRSFTEAHKKNYTNTIYQPAKITWSKDDFKEIFSKHDYNEILNSDMALYKWLHKLSIYGVALIQNTPESECAVDEIVKKIGFIKQTHYGVKFIVQHVQNTSNVAYLSNNLQMHTDLPYYEYCPGVNLLHCLEQTQGQGGDNLLSDCHYVASYMKEHYKDQYNILVDTEVEWSDVGTENGNSFFKLVRSPVISLDKHGEITCIKFSIPQRGSHFPGSIDLVKPWYEAHGLFIELNHKFAAKFKTRPGDILCFDNRRLLHGRNAYEDNLSNVRRVVGVYLDWDEIYSRWRCLRVWLEPKHSKSPA